MNTQAPSRITLKTLMASLESDDGTVRQNARDALVAFSGPAVPYLIKALGNSGSIQLRWEAAKALGAIRNPKSIKVLVPALTDKDSDVAWLAAEALIAFGEDAWFPLLRALIKDGPNSAQLRQGAHHVFSKQQADGFDDLLAALEKDLEPGKAEESAPVIAYKILKQMKAKT